jgi:hypothetical protein
MWQRNFEGQKREADPNTMTEPEVMGSYGCDERQAV